VESVKQTYYENQLWPRWRDHLKTQPSETLLIHGIMGADLYDISANSTLWLDVLGLNESLESLQFQELTPTGGVDYRGRNVVSRRMLQIPGFTDPYEGSINDQDLAPAQYCFDWRESIPNEARRLRRFLLSVRDAGLKRLNVVTHSMGGCLFLRTLLTTTELDDLIGTIVFCAPPFWGALAPLRVVERGFEGGPTGVFRSQSVQRIAATFPGLFQLLVAPRGLWPATLPGPAGPIPLEHPAPSSENLFRPAAWRNPYRVEWRQAILSWAETYFRHQAAFWAKLRKERPELVKRMHVVVGLNGKTPAKTERSLGDWTLHHQDPAPDRLGNGDGTVLLQSSYLEGIPLSQYWGVAGSRGNDDHAYLMSKPDVVRGVKAILEGKRPEKLLPFAEYMPKVDFSLDGVPAEKVGAYQGLSYREREHLRSLLPAEKWAEGKLESDQDIATFHTTRQAAIKVITEGAALESEAKRIGRPVEFLRSHTGRVLMPLF
jgi:pimeloyl-ACP methyl ester carboxylesterase